MQTSNNIYGLTTDRTDTDSHMIKNMEWAAAAYLTNSNYGRCSNNSCTEVTINNSSYVTGIAGDSISAEESTELLNTYETEKGKLASTTGNIYGIYDMSGCSLEFVIGNMSSASGSYTYYTSSGGTNFSYSASTARYIDRYAYGTTFTDQTSLNRARLGDATAEITLKTGTSANSWYSDYSYFVSSTSPWFRRSGYKGHTTIAGVFGFYNHAGGASGNLSTRAALIGL